MFSQDSLKQMVEVEEEMVKKAIDHLPPNNSFEELIIRGNIYKKHGLNPVYLSSPDGTHLIVTCRERLDAVLH